MRSRSCALSPTPVSVTVATAWLPAASAVTVTVPPEGVARPAILVAGLLGPDAAPYTQGRCCYDLCRLKLKGLIVKIEHTNTYVLTPDGQRFAVFYTKVHNRLLRPLLAAHSHLLRCPSGKPCAPSTGLSPTTCPTRA